jgi:hypothetical protein
VSQEATNRTFDELASGLASGTLSRGKALKLMGAALLGGTLASVVGIGEAAADRGGCKRNGKHCKRGTQCCSGFCSSSGTCVGGLGGGCAPDGEQCGNVNAFCCSGNCCNGRCRAAASRIICTCNDGAVTNICSSTLGLGCNDDTIPDVIDFCINECEQHQDALRVFCDPLPCDC